jgi:hypothetical protein
MKRSLIAVAASAALGGCYVVPMGNNNLDRLIRAVEQGQVPQPPAQQPPAQQTLQPGPNPALAKQVPSGPMSLPARLYPVNDIATEAGMVSGTITSLKDGKARFQLTYKGELLVGEATRVSGEDRKGLATAWGPSGAFMTCDYQMSAPVRGAGNCNFSDGARYQVHVGN